MQQQKMRIGRKQFRIGDLAKELHIKKYVIRFWEKEFELPSDRSEGGQRFYTQEDLEVFKKIKNLLYGQGFTINGAKKQLKTTSSKDLEVEEKHLKCEIANNTTSEFLVAATTTSFTPLHTSDTFLSALSIFKQDLNRLKEILDRLSQPMP